MESAAEGLDESVSGGHEPVCGKAAMGPISRDRMYGWLDTGEIFMNTPQWSRPLKAGNTGKRPRGEPEWSSSLNGADR
jgi:hypothetical protein